MALSREGDRREGLLLRQNRGWFQVSATGHEALAALVYSLEPDDYLYLYYRDRAIALARGLTNHDLALAYFAKQASSSAGRMMPAHYSSRPHNVFSVATPTGSQCLPAAGTAWAFRLAGNRHVVLCTIGDAAVRQGEFYEAVAFALQEKLPVVFVVEDNGYGISTPTGPLNPYGLGALSREHVTAVNGRDPFEVFEHGREAIEKARQGAGPTVLWCELDRIGSHTCSDDQRVYRTAEEIDEAVRRDPIANLAARLIRDGEFTQDEWLAMQTAIQEEVDRDYQDAEKAPDPDPAAATTHVHGPTTAPPARPPAPAEPESMVAAVNRTLRAALRDERVVLFGEDIQDPKGGVFGLTKGLSTEFPSQVFNAPLAEATIVGAAVGMAVAGRVPVFELQFIDFLPPALNQLITQVSSLRWRSKGDWQCPLVLLAPYGAYLPGGGVWHSESKEGLVAHIPGVSIAVPSTPQDAAGLLWAAIHGADPCLFLLPKHLFRQRMAATPPAATADAPPAFGRAAIRRAGHDVTVVTWGNCIELAQQAADQVAGAGVTAEIIDLRTLVPRDWDTIEQSLAKTGRLVVVHEDNRTGGFGQVLISEATAHPERWDLFLAPPQLVARADTPVPYNPALEYEVLPDVDRVVAAIQRAME
ncbi:MAG: 2-oxoisovalerate dehydrogenase [Candidatus Hydrogenedentes bacterium]|nr:2-oxoisovalerate dehydrogenase [Candidatus Hydrogenedentota bacterium]